MIALLILTELSSSHLHATANAGANSFGKASSVQLCTKKLIYRSLEGLS
jgi:hypothetical protein